MEKGTGAYATTVAAYGFIKLDKFLSPAEIKELMDELKKEMDAVTDPFHKQQLESQLAYLSNPAVGDVELIMVPKAFATSKPKDKGYVSFCGCIPVSLAYFQSPHQVLLIFSLSSTPYPVEQWCVRSLLLTGTIQTFLSVAHQE